MKYLSVLIFVLIMYVISLVIFRELDEHFDRSDIMLCNSAKISGNEEYLKKCQCFYKGESIRCIYE